MKRIHLAGLFFLWVNCALMEAQNVQPKPDPLPPSNYVMGPQLIVWSEMQKPQPVEPIAIPDAAQVPASQGDSMTPKINTTKPEPNFPAPNVPAASSTGSASK
jgi:hypothetical protein